MASELLAILLVLAPFVGPPLVILVAKVVRNDSG